MTYRPVDGNNSNRLQQYEHKGNYSIDAEIEIEQNPQLLKIKDQSMELSEQKAIKSNGHENKLKSITGRR